MVKLGRLIVVLLVIYGSNILQQVFGRIHGSEFVEIHPCEGFKIEIFQEGDHVQNPRY